MTKLLEVHVQAVLKSRRTITLFVVDEKIWSPSVVCSSTSGETIETALIKDESHSQEDKDEEKSHLHQSILLLSTTMLLQKPTLVGPVWKVFFDNGGKSCNKLWPAAQ